MFLVNSRLGLFTATSSRWYPFSRSYGVILPSSLERVISLPLVFSTSLPVSVSGTGTGFHHVFGFSWHYLPPARGRNPLPIHSGSGFFLCVPLTLQLSSPGILTRSPSTTPFDLALGPDSPSVDEPCGGTLRVSGYMILTYIFAT